MNGYEALAYLSKSPDNKVYRDSWCDGTKWVSMLKDGRTLFENGSIVEGTASHGIFGTLTGEGALEDGWHIYEQTYALSQAIDKVIAGKGRVQAHHKKNGETIEYNDGWINFSCESFDAAEQIGWTLSPVDD